NWVYFENFDLKGYKYWINKDFDFPFQKIQITTERIEDIFKNNLDNTIIKLNHLNTLINLNIDKNEAFTENNKKLINFKIINDNESNDNNKIEIESENSINNESSFENS